MTNQPSAFFRSLTGTIRRSRFISGCLFLGICFAHALRSENRITQPVDDSRRVELTGNLSPHIKSSIDQGPVDSAMELPYVTLMLKPSAAQQADLDQLLAHQQDPSSPDYHHWLTPEQYGERFGASQADIDKISAWLGLHNLTIKWVASGHNSIAFGGTAGQVESAFGIEIHRFQEGGELHYANIANPKIPVAFQGVVTAISGLHDFLLTPKLKPRSTKPLAQPRYNQGGQHYLAPGDLATIYDITPLYTAGINGTGQKIVIVGQTDLPLSDIQTYRTTFGLPANNPTLLLVPGTQDPGISANDLGESDLDVEVAGAIAPDATILFVYSKNVEDAFHYAIDQNLAPILSTSYGSCELQLGGVASAVADQVFVMQANAEGMTVFGPAGDNAATDCVGNGNAPGTYPDNLSLAVDYPASIPQVTAVGGTEFNEGSGTYWSTTNASNGGSALSYIPEMVWNDSVTQNSPVGGGGGLSVLFDKPWWQAGTGVPSDGVRDVPDVSLAAASDHVPYFTYSGGSVVLVGGTSAATPAFASIALLLEEYLVSNGIQTSPALGQINPVLYALAPVSGVFHDITVGSNIVLPCLKQTGCTLPGIGYHAEPGYDAASGLGSVDANNLVKAWHAASIAKTVTAMTLSASASSLPFTGTTVLTATVSGSGGPSGSVAFSVGNSLLGTAAIAGTTATLTVGGVQLAPGANTISAQYSGDTTHSGAAAFATVTVTSAGNGPPVIGGVSNSASFTQVYAPGEIISVFGTQLAPATAIGSAPLPAMLGGSSVTIGGVAAPFYYSSPTQLNIQIPYGIPPGSMPALTVTNGGQTASTTLTVSTVAPAIFAAGGAPIPYTTATQGQEVYLFITGAGALSPAIATGATPAPGTPVNSLPVPVGKVVVTVGGVSAQVNFAGSPTWAVGTVQINYTIPSNAPLGAQPVVVSVGGVASAPTTLTITQ
jgi:uncharacterized protein (TIGR03437 family)